MCRWACVFSVIGVCGERPDGECANDGLGLRDWFAACIAVRFWAGGAPDLLEIGDIALEVLNVAVKILDVAHCCKKVGERKMDKEKRYDVENKNVDRNAFWPHHADHSQRGLLDGGQDMGTASSFCRLSSRLCIVAFLAKNRRHYCKRDKRCCMWIDVGMESWVVKLAPTAKLLLETKYKTRDVPT